MHKFILRSLNSIYLAVSHPYSFLFMLFIVIFWGVFGSIMHYDEEWYKIAHIFEIAVSLLMLFLIENTQRADMRALQEKMDEIIKKMPQADDKKIKIEEKYKGNLK